MEKIGTDGRKKIILFDTTLRDGHQCPGAAIEKDEDYFNIVRGLDSIGFDICEVGFPSSSNHEASRVNRVAQMVRDGEISTIVGGLTQMVDFQVDTTLKALEPAGKIGKGFFHIYFPVDPELRQASIGSKVSNEEALKNVARFSRMAKDKGLIVQFSPEGYSKIGSNFDFCTELLIAAAENGTTYFNMPDTIGGEDPDSNEKEYYVNTILRHKAILDEKFPGNSFIWSVHNHNDLGNAVQNSVNGVKHGTGITKIEGTINGIGERAGNADLNQIVTRMKTTLADTFDIDHIDASKIREVSQLVASLMLPVQPNYPIVGRNAMRHTSGGHTNAMIKNPTVYQPFDPSLVGGEISLVYGPNSGGNLAVEIIEKNGFIAPKEKEEKRKLDEYLKAQMQDTGRYKGVTDEELLELYFEYMFPVKIESYGSRKEGDTKIFSFEGNIFGNDKIEISGKTPLSALKQIIDQKIPGFTTKEYHSNEEGHGIDAIAVGSIKIVKDGGEYQGIGKNQDIEMAAILALLDAYKKYYVKQELKQK